MVVFFMSFTLFICIVCKEINKKTSIPYSSLILFAGILMTFFSERSIIGQSVKVISYITSEELYYIFIPILIFEAGYNSDLFMYAY